MILTFTIIGPVFKGVSDGITNAIVWLYDTTGAFGMGVFGLTYSAIVTTGLHQSFPAVETQLLAAFAKNPASSGDFIQAQDHLKDGYHALPQETAELMRNIVNQLS